MSKMIDISLVCCSPSADKRSQVVAIRLEESVITARQLEMSDQELPADQAKGLHLAAHHDTHGVVTYLQQVTEGGFFVYVGDPANLEEHWFGEGSWVAFNDDQGPGHASKVGPAGVKRVFRLLSGHLR